MDEETVRRLFAEAEEPVRPQPSLGRIKHAANRRRLRNVGFQGAAVAAAAVIGVTLLNGVTPSESPDTSPQNESDAPSTKLACAGDEIKTITYDAFTGNGWSTPQRAVAASVQVNQGDAMAVASRRAEDATVLILRSNGTTLARFYVGPVPGDESRWQTAGGAACKGFDLSPPKPEHR